MQYIIIQFFHVNVKVKAQTQLIYKNISSKNNSLECFIQSFFYFSLFSNI